MIERRKDYQPSKSLASRHDCASPISAEVSTWSASETSRALMTTARMA
ncbi:hypothetical protein Gmet_3601 [Geobacter metallireducens GS-15]|uniref:Uncharacterized protein n=1 Tax=Geobacter metallireducens (strain ATCC 53774 / DSM 7210 / GS-15) TaxID=269799 RepID=J9JEN1_GEOMG|nr:hypothetical protein Gmet_3601 [Geobacter metallireducens GS-15]